MKKYLIFLIIPFILACSTRTEFVYPEIPELQEPPVVKDYELKQIKINKTKYFALTEENAKILSENWIHYKKWSETNYELLKSLKSMNKDKTNKEIK